jgi:hypothetical protein
MTYPYRVEIVYKHGRPELVAGFHNDNDARLFMDTLVREAPRQGWLSAGVIKLINNQTEEILLTKHVEAGK